MVRGTDFFWPKNALLPITLIEAPWHKEVALLVVGAGRSGWRPQK
jgi:hypothetical protein